MFKNILHDPKNVTEQELIFLDQRRKMEKQMILDKDITSQDQEGDQDKDDNSVDNQEDDTNRIIIESLRGARLLTELDVTALS